MDNEIRFDTINTKSSQIMGTINRLKDLHGISLETLNALLACRSRSLSIFRPINELRNTTFPAGEWADRQVDWDSADAELDAIFTEVQSIQKRIGDETQVFSEISNSISVDTTAAEMAYTHHIRLSYFTLASLFVLIPAGLFSLLATFGIIDLMDSRGIINSLLSHLGDQKAEISTSLAIEIALVAGGRIFYIVIFAWFMSFLGRLHRRHSAQAVTYRDKIVGLEIARLILSVGNETSREKTIDHMALSYINKRDNAFLETETIEKQENLISWFDLIKMGQLSKLLK